MAEKKDWWDKTDVMVKGLWPVVAFVLAFLYRQQQDIIAAQEKTAERVTHLAEQLATNNDVGKKIALMLLQEEKKRHPDDVPQSIFTMIGPELVSGAVNSENKQLAEEYKKTALALAPSGSVEEVIKNSINETTSRVYIHLVDDSQKRLASQARDALVSADIVVPPDRVVATGPSRTQLRYFKPEEEPEARRIAALLESAHITPLEVQRVGGYEQSPTIRPNHFELWFAVVR